MDTLCHFQDRNFHSVQHVLRPVVVREIVYLEGLNGIRAMAAMAVIISHITLSLHRFDLDPYLFGSFDDGNPRGLDMAGYGVSMFFALSGFLITFLLLKEKQDRSKINVRKFYVRRILRIWPLYYAYLLLCLVYFLIFSVDFSADVVFWYVFFGANIPFILQSALPLLAHYWSLGVEEQFYLFWPWVVKISNSRLLYVSLILTAILIGTKICLHIFMPHTVVEQILEVTRFQCMLMGGVTAILFFSNHRWFLNPATSTIVQMGCWLCLGLVAINKFHIASFLDNEILAAVTCLIIVGQVTKKGLINLENNIMDFLGKISYGTYVIHPMIIMLGSKFINLKGMDGPAIYILLYIVLLSATVIVSFASYQYLEKPFLKLKAKRYSVITTSGTKNHTNFNPGEM